MRHFRPPGLLPALLTILLLAAAGIPGSRAADPAVLIETNGTWRLFKGTTEASPANPGAWRTPGFADGAFQDRPAPFWYGESARFGNTGTELTDMVNSYSTLFLRRTFRVTDPAAVEELLLLAMCDDGFRAWINGIPVAGSAPPAGEPLYNSLASANAPEPVALTPYPVSNPAAVLVPGDNILAVQVFNTALGSSDLVFDAGLVATLRQVGPPTIIGVSPTPGLVTALDRITVTFNEPVRGVRAEDFLVNGASATGVSGAGATYTFTFPRPPFGAVGVSWSTFNTIEDFETPPRHFEVSSPGSTWGYELLDPEGPTIATRQPPAGSTVRSLSQVEVTFDKAVTGIDAADLAVNGTGATRVSGFGAGPYLFEFPPIAAAGTAKLAWVAGHGIASDTADPRPFAGGGWDLVVNPGSRPVALSMTEFMAENFTAYRDEDQDPEDWIEIHNPTGAAVNLAGWSLSNDPGEPGLWVFPSTSIPANGYLVVFASGKDRRPAPPGRLHTGFKLNANGGTLALYPPELPRQAISEVTYARQGPDFSAGRENNTGAWRHFKGGSPGARNGTSTVASAVDDVRFSASRGFFAQPFNLSLAVPTAGASIRYTTNGSPPTESTGFLYAGPIPITASRVIRAAAFLSNSLPSRVATHTYLVNLPASRLRLPALSLVTATNNLYGRTGIMEVSPRNTTQRGAAWERPVSAEYIRVGDNGGFQVDCGLRLQGGDYVRGQYNYRSTALPFSKYSFRLYFRGEYGQGRLEYPLFPETTQTSFDTIVLRAGMNDHSNPYLLDEFVRTLARDCSQPSPVGDFVHLFLNGVYKGYYNPCERVDVDFLRAYHGGGDKWDLMAQMGEVREGDATAWNNLRNLANTRNLAEPSNYLDIAGRLDLTNFVDYLLPLIYVDNDDWPHNNWRAARERVPGGRYRMYVWDAEWSFGVVNGHAPTFDTIANQLSSTAPPWGGADIQRIFNGLKKAPEFKLLFADRVHRHLYNGGALTDERLRSRYAEITNRLNGVVAGFNNRIGSTWIPQRRRSMIQQLVKAGFFASSNAPAFSQHGGRVPGGYALSATNLEGPIYFTTDGSDPRVAFSGEVSPAARAYNAPLVLTSPVVVRARSLSGTNWSALTEAAFQINLIEAQVRFTEVMYHPPGGDTFEFVEIANLGATPVDVAGWSFGGIDFRFPEPLAPMPPGARWVIANNARPADFLARYPGLTVAGWFGGSLANGGERLDLNDRNGRTIDTVEYDDQAPWPVRADGNGASIELTTTNADASDPAAWSAAREDGGTPAGAPAQPPAPPLLLSEVFAGDADPAHPDWVELRNAGSSLLNLAGWSLSDGADPRAFVFPANTPLGAGALLRVWCDSATNAPGLHTGFALRSSGETLALYDPATNRVDAVTWGPLPQGFTLIRPASGTVWALGEPTPGAANEPAPYAPFSRLSINEWLANASPGSDDWIELHNADPDLPVALAGAYLATSNALHRIRTPAFVAPSGFVTLTSDGNPGPDHLSFSLPAAGGAILLLDPSGNETTRVTYGRQAEGVSLGRVPDATGAPVPLPGTASPGASNYVTLATGPRLNEFMARNNGAMAGPGGRAADWIELHNPSPARVSLAGASISLGEARPRQWTFPAGAAIPAGGFLVLDCDPALPASTNLESRLNLGRALPGEGGEIWLFDASNRLWDTVRFGAQIEDRPVGRTSTGWALLDSPTPGAANAPASPLGIPANARLNEWSAANDGNSDWFEIHNPEPLPIDLGGHLLTDDPSLAGRTNHVIAPLTFLPAGGFARWFADGRPELGPDHVRFRLDAWGETLRLYDPAAGLVDSIDLVLLRPGGSEGRLPDGSAEIVRFDASSSPGAPNWLPHEGVLINELLAHTDPPLEDAIELHNPSGRTFDLSGWHLSDDDRLLTKIRIPDGTVLQPGGYLVFYESLFNAPAAPGRFTLNSAHGGALWLSETRADGSLTGRRAHARFEASANAESFGRHRTSVGWDFPPQSRRTFGMDQPPSVAEFRRGSGLPNAYPRVGPIVVSEMLYRPLVVTGTNTVEDPGLEFVELHNLLGGPVGLFDPRIPANTWRLRGGVEFEFPPGITLNAGARALVLPFAPTNDAAMAAFRGRFAIPAGTQVFGPFRGRLSNEGDRIRIERPDNPQTAPSPDAGYVPWLLVEEVAYRPTAPWPTDALEAGRSLQRRNAAAYGNDPANWIAAIPTPGGTTLAPATDRDLDGIPNEWESLYGLNPADAADAAMDPDGDSFSNLEEFVAGTHPGDPSSRLGLTVAWQASAGPVLRFRAAADRTYSVLQRTDAEFGSWRKVFDIAAETADRDASIPLDPAAASTRFFRVVTPALPD